MFATLDGATRALLSLVASIIFVLIEMCVESWFKLQIDCKSESSLLANYTNVVLLFPYSSLFGSYVIMNLHNHFIACKF